jgi:hypothetical protein
MIDESAIIPFATSAIGFFCLIGVCLGCRRMIIKKQVERERQLEYQQAPPTVAVVADGGYVGGFTVGYPGYGKQAPVYPMYGTPAYGYREQYPQPSAPPAPMGMHMPPGNYLATSVTV